MKIAFDLIKYALQLTLLVVLIGPLSAVFAGQENIRFQRITLEDGLSQESVLSIFQDSEGYMWFGTQEGLNRYDGYQFKVFARSTRKESTLSSDWIYSISESNDGLLWVGTSDGANVFDKKSQTFQTFKHDPLDPTSLDNNNVRVVFKDSTDTIWLGTDVGLNRYIPSQQNFKHYPLTGAGLGRNANIYTISEDIAGGLWIGTDGNGLYRFDPLSDSVNLISTDYESLKNVENTRIRALLIDSRQRLWVGTYDNGLFMVDLNLDPVKNNVTTQPDANLVVRDIFEDRTGTIWIAADNGLHRWHDGKQMFQRIAHESDNPFSLSGDKLTRIFQDRGGVFWVGSYSGLNKWNTATAKFSYFRKTSSNGSYSLTDNNTNAFFNAGDDKVWVGTYNGLNLVDIKSGDVEHYFHDDSLPVEQSLKDNLVMSLHARNDQELFIGYRNDGMSLLNRKTGLFEHFQYDPLDNNSLGSNAITFIKKSYNDKLWVGSFNGGLNLFDPVSKSTIRYQHNDDNPQSLSSNKVISLLQDSKGLLWVGTFDKGLNIFNPTTGTSLHIENDPSNLKGLGSNTVWSIHEDQLGNIWAGTQGGGLVKLSAENRLKGVYEFDKITRYEGLPSNVVYGIIEDQDGILWLSTNRGISKYNPIEKTLLNYDSSHGLQGNEFNAGAYFKNYDGRIFFGGTNGVTSFYPQDISPNDHVPPVVLTKFQKLNEVIAIDSDGVRNNKIQISHKDYLIAFEFAGLDFASPVNNRYIYKLDGFDDNWIEAGDIRKATYTNLPAGNYVFRVKASNNDGVWNEQGADVALTVLPAPWYSWWAYMIYAAFALGLLYWIYRSYVNKLEKEANYRHELEQEVKNRTVELRLANEQLLNASVTDQLTGLHNRRYLNSIVEQQCASIFREFEEHLSAGKMTADGGPRLFFLMFDLDGFKPINDTYGHDAGDKVICQVGELLRTVCRKSDIVIRWGGDEFLIMGRVEEVNEIEMLAERLRSKISSYGFDIDLKQKMHLSCSIGYSMYPFSHHYPDSLSWEQVHLLADNALYKSKECGRNQWTGILQSLEMPPVNIMNTLTRNIDNVIGEGYVRVRQASRENAPKVLDIKSRRN